MCLCEFGCGKEATYQFKSSGKWCCSSNVNACDGKKKKDSELKKGKTPLWKNGHPKGMTGKQAHNKNKTLEERYGMEKAKIIRNKMSESMKGSKGWSKIDSQTLTRIKKEASERAYRRHAEGWQGAIGKCRKIKYFSPIAGDIIVDGKWELSVAEYLDAKKLSWKRNKNRFKYFYEEKVRFYTPDFYVDEWKSYIEVKGYETDLDRAKWSQFTEKLTIWKKEKIKEIRKEMEH